jgi:hypothetical protein
MTFLSTLLCFTLDKEESLGGLVKECGYTAPTVSQPRAFKKYPGFTALIERVPGETHDRVFIEVRSDNQTVQGIEEVFADLERVGIYNHTNI